MSQRFLQISVALCLVVIAASLRILPHPDNFVPVAAVALFGGAVLPRRLALFVPLSVMVLSDLVIGWHDLVAVTWGSYALIALAASFWLRKVSFGRTVVLTLGSALFFFVATNFAVWVTSGMYPHTWAGLGQCFTMALPFFRNSLMSDLFFVAVLFGAYYLAVQLPKPVGVAKQA